MEASGTNSPSGTKKKTEQPSEEDVVRYLKNHPGFFLTHEDLLLELRLNHPSGGAVSLLERQVALLRERNMELRGRLTNLLENARNNDQLFDQTRQLVLSLIESRDLNALSHNFQHSLTAQFGVDFAQLTVFGEANSRRKGARVVAMDQARPAIGHLLSGGKAVCGVLRPAENRFLFPDGGDQVGSAALVPVGAGYPQAVLAIGSRDEHYFRSSMGTLFLGYLADVVARLLPALTSGHAK